MKKYTTESLAAALGISRDDAYSLQVYLRHVGALVENGEVIKKDGTKGKGATVFVVDAAKMADVCEKLKSL